MRFATGFKASGTLASRGDAVAVRGGRPSRAARRRVDRDSMGGMEAWLYAEKHPEFMDIAVPMASDADRDVGTRPDPAAADRRLDPQRPGRARRQLRAADTERKLRQRLLQLRDQWRQPGDPAHRADPRQGRRAGRSAAPRAVRSRRERRAPPVGRIERLRSGSATRTHPRDGPRDQFGGRRTQSAGARHPRSRDPSRAEGPGPADPASDQTSGDGTTFCAKWWKKDLDALLQSVPRAAPTP